MSSTPQALAAFAESGSAVTITRKDGKVAAGSLVALGDDRYKVATGRAGRPLILTAEQVAEVATA